MAAGGLVGLVVVALLTYAATFDLNAWKARIEAGVSKAPHMKVTIQGTIDRKRWFPLTIAAHGLRLQNREEMAFRHQPSPHAWSADT